MAKKMTDGILGGVDTVIDTYVKLVRSGKLDIEKVPIKYRERVREIVYGNNE